LPKGWARQDSMWMKLGCEGVLEVKVPEI